MREAILLAGGLLLLYNAMDRSEARAEAQVEGKGHTQTLNTASQYDYRSDHAHILNALTTDIDDTGPTLTKDKFAMPLPGSGVDVPPGGLVPLNATPIEPTKDKFAMPLPGSGVDPPQKPDPIDPGAGEDSGKEKRRRRRKKRSKLNQALTAAQEVGDDEKYAELKNRFIDETVRRQAEDMTGSSAHVGRLLASVVANSRHLGNMTPTLSADEVEALKIRAASNEAARNILLDDVREAQRQGLSYDKFREGYRPVGGDESLRAIWESEASVPVDITSPKAAEFSRYTGHVELLRDLENSVAQDMSFTEALMARDSRDIVDGRLSTRITADSGTVQYWTELGGNLTDDELNQITSNTREAQVERVIQGEPGAPVRPRFTAADVESVRFDKGLLDQVYETTTAIGRRLAMGEAVVLPEGFGDAGNYTLFRETAGDVRPSGYNPLAQEDDFLRALDDLTWTGGDGSTVETAEEFGALDSAVVPGEEGPGPSRVFSAYPNSASSRAGRTAKMLGRALGPLGAAAQVGFGIVDAVGVENAYARGEITEREREQGDSGALASTGGALMGAAAGAEGGAVAGLGCGPFAWVCSPLFALGGGIGGGIGGFFAGQAAGSGIGGAVYDLSGNENVEVRRDGEWVQTTYGELRDNEVTALYTQAGMSDMTTEEFSRFRRRLFELHPNSTVVLAHQVAQDTLAHRDYSERTMANYENAYWAQFHRAVHTDYAFDNQVDTRSVEHLIELNDGWVPPQWTHVTNVAGVDTSWLYDTSLLT